MDFLNIFNTHPLNNNNKGMKVDDLKTKFSFNISISIKILRLKVPKIFPNTSLEKISWNIETYGKGSHYLLLLSLEWDFANM